MNFSTDSKQKPPPFQPERRKSSDRRADTRRHVAARIFLRGTNLQPPGYPLKSCLAGTKQSILVDMLRKPEGATMSELIEALSGGSRPWTEATVRSGFGWDLKQKGYGVRSEFDSTGQEHFHLIMPKGCRIPKHATERTPLRRRTAHKPSKTKH